jgi:hypothetical protein
MFGAGHDQTVQKRPALLNLIGSQKPAETYDGCLLRSCLSRKPWGQDPLRQGTGDDHCAEALFRAYFRSHSCVIGDGEFT